MPALGDRRLNHEVVSQDGEMNRDLRRDNARPILPHRCGVIVLVIKGGSLMMIIISVLDGMPQMRVSETARVGVVGITVVKVRKRRTDARNPYEGSDHDAESLARPLHLSLPSECTLGNLRGTRRAGFGEGTQ